MHTLDFLSPPLEMTQLLMICRRSSQYAVLDGVSDDGVFVLS